jgi:hypothetical protein
MCGRRRRCCCCLGRCRVCPTFSTAVALCSSSSSCSSRTRLLAARVCKRCAGASSCCRCCSPGGLVECCCLASVTPKASAGAGLAPALVMLLQAGPAASAGHAARSTKHAQERHSTSLQDRRCSRCMQNISCKKHDISAVSSTCLRAVWENASPETSASPWQAHDWQQDVSHSLAPFCAGQGDSAQSTCATSSVPLLLPLVVVKCLHRLKLATLLAEP